MRRSARPRRHLDDDVARRAVPGATEYIYWDDSVRGFGLRVRPNGTQSYIFRFAKPGLPRKPRIFKQVSLGERARQQAEIAGEFDGVQRKGMITFPPGTTADEARGYAEELAAYLRRGGDPEIEWRRRQALVAASIAPIQQTYREYVEQHLSKRSPAHRRNVERTFERKILPNFAGKSVSEIRRSDIERLIERSFPSGQSIHAALSSFLAWCVAQRILDANPARGVSGSNSDGDDRPARSPRLLSIPELALIWRGCDRIPPHWGVAVRLAIASAQRWSDVIGSRWDDVDLAGENWVVRHEDEKRGIWEKKRLPISALLREVFLNAPGDGRGYLFDSPIKPGAPLQGTAYAVRMLRDVTQFHDWALRDIRYSAAQHMRGLGIAPHVIEAVLRHRAGLKRLQSQFYSEYEAESREALERWGDELRRTLASLPANHRHGQRILGSNEGEVVL